MSENASVTRNADKRDEAALLPPVDVVEDADGITLWADLPGVSKESLNLQLEADKLTIEGEVALVTPEGMEAAHAEVGLPRYRRVFASGLLIRSRSRYTLKLSIVREYSFSSASVWPENPTFMLRAPSPPTFTFQATGSPSK